MVSLPFIDQMGRTVTLNSFPPNRIISLVPSQTELLYDLGLEEKVVGITKFCIHPSKWHQSKIKVGGTKQYKFDIIKRLNPDLIIGNKEENEKDQILTLAKHYPVWLSDIYTFNDAMHMIREVGKLVGQKDKAKSLSVDTIQRYDTFPKVERPIKVAYFIWRKPYMVAGAGTFIHHMLEKLGFTNVFAQLDRYPIIELEILKTLTIDYIFLSSEPYPFKAKHLEEFHDFCQADSIMLIDGESFSWYGSRLLKSADYLYKLLTDTSKAV